MRDLAKRETGQQKRVKGSEAGHGKAGKEENARTVLVNMSQVYEYMYLQMIVFKCACIHLRLPSFMIGPMDD